jgi:hypothetical protein
MASSKESKDKRPAEKKIPSSAASREPFVVYCGVHSVCYTLFSNQMSTPHHWNATDVTRASLGLYLVIQGFRRGYYLTGAWAPEYLDGLVKTLGLRVRGDGRSSTLVVNENAVEDPENVTGAIFGSEWSLDSGSLTWVCHAGGNDLALWAEPLPKDATYVWIETHLQELRALLSPLGYSAHARVETRQAKM